MKRAARIAGMFVCVAVLSGCVLVGDKLDEARWRFTTIPYFVFDNAEGYKQPEQPRVMENSTNVAIAISGGGLRSAVFAAGVMEQLAYVPGPRGRSVLESADMICGVSGGSLAAAYYGLYKPDRFASNEQICEFFQHFKSQMTFNLFARSSVHYLSHPWEGALTYYTRYRFSQTLANTLDQHMFYNATFGDLHKRELAGIAPVIMLNATSLDTGQKFLFSNMNVCENVNVDAEALMPRLPKLVPSGDLGAFQVMTQIAGSPIYTSFGFDSINSDIESFRLSSAIAASSAYPIIPGPAALIDYANNGYVHLGDGGVNDNSGVDAIVQTYLKQMEKNRSGKRLVVISINAAEPVKPKWTGNPNGFVSSITYGERANTIIATRAQTFATALYNAPSSIKVITLNLCESEKANQLQRTMSHGSVTEQDMLSILAAATEIMQAQGSAIQAAIAAP